MGKPLVSVIINNYNYADFLSDAIESVLGQSYQNVEAIVVDDGSSDQSRQVIDRYLSNGRVRAIFKENGGQASAINAGIAAATGDIICLLDSDDWFAPEKVEQVVNDLLACPEAGWHVHPLVWKASRNAHSALCVVPVYEETRCLDLREKFAQGRSKVHFSATSGLCFRRDLLQSIAPIPESLRITADNYLKFAAAVKSPVFLQKKPLAFQRIHGSNAYTGKRDKGGKDVEIHIAIGRAMLERFPEARSFVFKLLTRQAALALHYRRMDLAVNALAVCCANRPTLLPLALGRTFLVFVKIAIERTVTTSKVNCPPGWGLTDVPEEGEST